MKRNIIFTVIILMTIIALPGPTIADGQYPGWRYEITITNLTSGQIFSPPIILNHTRKFKLFELGEPATDQLIALAEDGLTEEYEILAESSIHIQNAVVSETPILPGKSVTLKLKANHKYRWVTIAGMLVITNDAFFAKRSIKLPHGKGIWRSTALAYDAGSEFNSENCAFIPGPPCNSPDQRDPDGSEGYVHVHPGIHGIGEELTSDLYDWKNPVAEIKIRKLRSNHYHQ